MADQVQRKYPMLEIPVEISRRHPVQSLVESAGPCGARQFGRSAVAVCSEYASTWSPIRTRCRVGVVENG